MSVMPVWLNPLMRTDIDLPQLTSPQKLDSSQLEEVASMGPSILTLTEALRSSTSRRSSSAASSSAASLARSARALTIAERAVLASAALGYQNEYIAHLGYSLRGGDAPLLGAAEARGRVAGGAHRVVRRTPRERRIGGLQQAWLNASGPGQRGDARWPRLIAGRPADSGLRSHVRRRSIAQRESLP